MTIKVLNKMQTPGMVPPEDYNDLVTVVDQIQNMEVGGGLELSRGPLGWLLSFVRVPLTIATFVKEGLLVIAETVAINKLFVIKPFTIEDVVAYVNVKSTSGSIDLDIHVSDTADDTDLGTSIYNKGSSKPSILVNEFIDVSSKPDTKSISAGQFLQVDTDSVGEGAENLTVIIFGRE